jgi:hypothetical protein
MYMRQTEAAVKAAERFYGLEFRKTFSSGVRAVADAAHVTLTKDKSCDKRVTGEGDKLLSTHN